MAVWQRVMCGGCLCGAVRYEASRLPLEVYYCHCEVCRRTFGNIVVVRAQFAADSFHTIRGKITFYRYSDIAQRGFCKTCDTQLVIMGLEVDEPVAVALRSLDRLQDLGHEGHFGVESKVPWFNAPGRSSSHPHRRYSEFRPTKAVIHLLRQAVSGPTTVTKRLAASMCMLDRLYPVC